jgi:hypothetical protein
VERGPGVLLKEWLVLYAAVNPCWVQMKRKLQRYSQVDSGMLSN